MVSITSFEDSFYYPPSFDGLEELIRFPDGGVKKNGIANGTIWTFDSYNHEFQSEIHGGDLGCGMSAFLINDIDHKKAADELYLLLKKKNILGRGNHFIDICSKIDPIYQKADEDYKVLLIHTHGKDHTIPNNLKNAYLKQEKVSEERIELGYSLSKTLGVNSSLLGDWPHNTVEENNGKIIYRKGAVKVKSEKLYFLPAHLGAKILVYTIDENNQLPYSSMPHATGRVGPRGETKVTPEKAAELRKLVYIPEGISNNSLRTEHPSCYNDFEKIYKKLDNQFKTIGQVEILSYVGKI